MFSREATLPFSVLSHSEWASSCLRTAEKHRGLKPNLNLNLSVLRKEDNFCDFLLLPWLVKPFKKGSTLKGNNLLLGKQIISFKG